METKKKKFSSVTAYSLLSVLFGGSLLVTAISIFYPILSFFITAKMPPTWFGLKVGLIQAANSVVSKVGEANSTYGVTQLQGSLIIFDPSLWVSILSNLVPIFYCGSLTYGVFLLRKIIKNVHLGNQFAAENVKHTRIIATLVIVVPHIKTILQNIILSSLPHELNINGLIVYRMISAPIYIFNFVILPDVILLGLILFVFAEIFKEGKTMKEEIELTV